MESRPRIVAKATPGQLLGEWRIIETDLWDQDDLDLVAQATIAFAPDSGHACFLAVELELDYRLTGHRAVEWSFHGFDEGDEVMGRGHAAIDGEILTGKMFFHQGDEFSFVAKRKPSANRADSRMDLT